MAWRQMSRGLGRRLLMTAAAGIGGYLVGAFAGGYLLTVLTSNTHDASLEGAMTGAFVIGPLVGLIAAVIGFARSR